MIPYFGNHSFKIFIRGKPIRFGYKKWIFASSCDYPLKFETYVGASEMRRDQLLGPCIASNLFLSKIQVSIVYTLITFLLHINDP